MATNLVNGAMEMLHDQSLPTIELLQSSFPNNKNFMINVSTLFDPRYVFLIYAPILFAINKRVGHRMLIALTLTEWANQILKWLLAGERPYWYVHERANQIANNSLLMMQQDLPTTGIDSYDMAISDILNLGSNSDANSVAAAAVVPQLKQFPVTCELGAGSPSGHAMVTATVWYILIDAYLKNELPIFKHVNYRTINQENLKSDLILNNLLSKITWSLYTIALLMVSLSRVYLACHFPHQCLCGAILGAIVAKLVIEKLPMELLEKRHFILTTLTMFTTALATYFLLKSLGINPLWSVDKGMRWCIKKEYIHLDTTPFFSMMRYLGFCLGAGLAYNSEKIRESLSKSAAVAVNKTTTLQLFLRRSTVAFASIAFGQLLLSMPMPKGNLNLFYVISFLMYTLFTYAIAAPIPRIVKRQFSEKKVDQVEVNY